MSLILNGTEITDLYLNGSAMDSAYLNGVEVFSASTVDVHDVFGDGSCIATYQLDGNANDLSGTYNGTANNVTYSTGEFGQAGIFNGSSSSVYCMPLDSATAYSMSVSLWFKANSIHTGTLFNGRSYNYVSYGGTLKHLLQTRDNGLLRSYFRNYTNSNYTPPDFFNYSPNIWYHVVGCFDDSTKAIKVYVNGVERTTAVGSGNFTWSEGKGNIGVHQYRDSLGDVQSNYFDGSIDQVRIFTKALTPAEVQHLYTKG